jgi:hypothetical protein
MVNPSSRVAMADRKIPSPTNRSTSQTNVSTRFRACLLDLKAMRRVETARSRPREFVSFAPHHTSGNTETSRQVAEMDGLRRAISSPTSAVRFDLKNF